MCPRLASFLYVLEGGLWLLSILPPRTEYWDGSHVTPHWGASSRRCASRERALPVGPHLQPFLSLFLKLRSYFYFVCVPGEKGTNTEAEDNSWPCFLLPPRESYGWNSACQAWQQAPLPTEPPHCAVHLPALSFSSQWEARCHFSSFGSSRERWASDSSPTLPF